MHKGDDAGALKLAGAYTQANPNSADGWQALGQVRLRIGDLAGAEQAYRTALELDPSSEWSTYRLATVLADQGNLHSSGQLLESLRSTNPSSWWALAGLANIAIERRDWEEARTKARSAEERLPARDKEAILTLATIVGDIPGEHDWELRLLRRGLGLGEDLRALVLLALLLEEKEPSESKRHLDRARSQWPGGAKRLERDYLPGLRAGIKQTRHKEE